MQTEELLGSMGTPIKLTIKDTPVLSAAKVVRKTRKPIPIKR